MASDAFVAKVRNAFRAIEAIIPESAWPRPAAGVRPMQHRDLDPPDLSRSEVLDAMGKKDSRVSRR
jgi:hypothetical protein